MIECVVDYLIKKFTQTHAASVPVIKYMTNITLQFAHLIYKQFVLLSLLCHPVMNNPIHTL